jgi:serine/threonine protein kinase
VSKTLKTLHSKRRVEIMYDVSLALTYLHQSKNIYGHCVHGDVMSDGIVLASDGTAMLLSCGLSDIYVSLQNSGQMLGTPGYRCPWYGQGGKRFRSECDIYSFGMVMIELITSRLCHDTDRYLISNDGVRIMMSDADQDAGMGWMHKLRDLCSLALACIDPNIVRRPTAEKIRDNISEILGNMDSEQ